MAEFPNIFACVSGDKALFLDEDERTLEKYPARSAVMSTPRGMSCKGRRRRKKPARKLRWMMRWMQRRQSRRKPSQPPMKRLKRHHPSTSRMKRRCRLTSQSSLHPRHPTRQRQTAKRNRSSRRPRWTRFRPTTTWPVSTPRVRPRRIISLWFVAGFGMAKR